MQLDAVNKAVVQLLLDEPFYGHYLTAVVKTLDTAQPRTQISFDNHLAFKIEVSPEQWRTSTTPQRVGILKHQCLHLIYKHPTQMLDYANKTLFSIAADLEVNQYLTPAQHAADALTLDHFPGLTLKSFAGSDYYYQQLLALYQQTHGNGGAHDGAMCEANAGYKIESNANQTSPEADQALQTLLQAQDGPLSEHQNWHRCCQTTNENDCISANRLLLERNLDTTTTACTQRLQSAYYQFLPATLVTYLEQLRHRFAPSVNWRLAMRLFQASGQRTRLKTTLKRPSKRYGTTPGIKLQALCQLSVVIDTSGSIRDDDLQRFFDEIYHLAHTQSLITMIEADAEVQRHYRYRQTAPPRQIQGRGGTQFDPAIQFANQHPCDALIYLTDGYASAITISPRMPVMWLITPNGCEPGDKYWQQLPGRVVKMNP